MKVFQQLKIEDSLFLYHILAFPGFIHGLGCNNRIILIWTELYTLTKKRQGEKISIKFEMKIEKNQHQI